MEGLSKGHIQGIHRAYTGAVGKGWRRGPPVGKDESPGYTGLALRLLTEGTYPRQNRNWNPLLFCRPEK